MLKKKENFSKIWELLFPLVKNVLFDSNTTKKKKKRKNEFSS